MLLKNSGNVLPLSGSKDGSIAVIGADASTSPQTAGGGSASVTSSGTITPLQGITAAAPSGVTVSYNNGSSDSSAASAAAAASVAVVFANLNESEGSDLTSIDLGSAQDNLISAVAAANPNTIVVLNTGSAVVMPWLSSVKGVLEAWYPGQEDGTAIASLLFGAADPSGHLTVSFPTSLSQVPASTAAAVARRERLRAVLRGRRRRLPLVQLAVPDAAVPVRLRPLLHQLLVQQPEGRIAGRGRRGHRHRHRDQYRRRRRGRRRAAVRDRPGRLRPAAAAARGLPAGLSRAGREPDGHVPADPAEPAVLELDRQQLGHLDRQLRDQGRRLRRKPPAVRHPRGSGGAAWPAGHHHQPGTARRIGRRGRVGRGEGQRQQQRADPDVHRHRPARGNRHLRLGNDHGNAHHGRHLDRDRQRQRRHGATASTTFTWTVEPATDGIATTPLVGYDGLCLDVTSDNNTNGTAVDVYTCNGTNGQQWTEEAERHRPGGRQVPRRGRRRHRQRHPG